jgi:hypothetical protein
MKDVLAKDKLCDSISIPEQSKNIDVLLIN